MKQFTVEHAPSDIIKTFPRASDIFKVYQINYCCSGHHPLGETFEKDTNLDGNKIMDELNNSYTDWLKEVNDTIDPDTATPSDIIDHIIKKHHPYFNNELMKLEEFVTRIYKVHGNVQPHLEELNDLYNTFRIELQEKIIKEENDLFPSLIQNAEEPTDERLQLVDDLSKQIDNNNKIAKDLLEQMSELTNEFELPENACGTYQIAYARLREIKENTMIYIRLSDKLLSK